MKNCLALKSVIMFVSKPCEFSNLSLKITHTLALVPCEFTLPHATKNVTQCTIFYALNYILDTHYRSSILDVLQFYLCYTCLPLNVRDLLEHKKKI